jgi:lipoprotein-releasing system permease protein
LSIERFIARKILFNAPKSFSRYIVSIAIVAVGLSLSVMIVATAMVNGFQKEISSKVYGFWGHIHITKFGFSKTLEDNPISTNVPFYPSLDTFRNVRHIQVFANKAGIIKTSDQIEGIIMKGVGRDFDWDFFRKYLVKGETFITTDSLESRKILISAQTAGRLSLDTGDVINVYFIQNPPRVRRLEVSGIYNSGLEEYDKYYALVDIRQVQRLNDWDDTLVSGFEVYLDDVSRLHETSYNIYYDALGPYLTSQTIDEIYPNIFDWLSLQNTNEIIILALMALVAAINMITCLLILILERTNMIGILKALGAENKSIRRIFLYKASYILALGLLAGNIIGIGICLLQKYFHIIRLPEESYYVSVAPVEINLSHVILLNAATFLICMIALLLPTILAGRITPVKAIRFQ